MSYNTRLLDVARMPDFFEGRTPPKHLHIRSPQMRDWYDEQIYRCWYGYEKNGYRMTGDHYFFLNFVKIELFLKDPLDPKRTISYWDWPLWSSTDDYIFKQFEEAEQADLSASMLFTGRGLGKTFITLAPAVKNWYLDVGSHNIISGSIDDHASATFTKLHKILDACDKAHPFLRLNRLESNDDFIQAGQISYVEGIGKEETLTSSFEKIIYANKAGKSKGRRLRYQLFEEAGDWTGAASLVECIAASEGSWKVGDTKTCRVFYIGTGGTIHSSQARDMFLDPEAFGIYPVIHPDGKKTGIFIPAMQKRGGSWEDDKTTESGIWLPSGYSDEKKAEASLDAEREKNKSQPLKFDKLVQEYPKTWEECFQQSGAAIFDRQLLGFLKNEYKAGRLTMPGMGPDGKPRKQTVPDRGRLEFRKDAMGRKIGVEFFHDPKGKIEITEHPKIGADGLPVHIENLYIGGLDSIDQSKEDSMGKNGSSLCLLIKKRYSGENTTGNIYVCDYTDRPEGDVDEAFENVVKILWYYNCRVNLEYTKITIKPFFKNYRPSQFWRFIERPKNISASIDPEKRSNLIGTHMVEHVRVYGVKKIQSYLAHDGDTLRLFGLMEQLFDYNVAEKTKYDKVIAMMLCEIADEDMSDLLPREVKKQEESFQMPVWYRDAEGYKKFGVPPKRVDSEFQPTNRRSSNISYIDDATQEMVYVDGSTYDGFS